MKNLPRHKIGVEDFRFNRVARIPIKVSFTRKFGQNVTLVLSYIPHKLLITHSSIDAWLLSYQKEDLALEMLAAKLIDDINNELVPYWVSLNIINEKEGFDIFAEDCQPTWRGKTKIIPELSQRNFSRLMRR